MDKKEIRKLIRERKKQLTHENIREYSERAAHHTGNLLRTVRGEAKTIGVFLSLPDELQTGPLIDLLHREFPDLRVLVPQVQEDNEHILFFEYIPDGPHTISRYGIWEPLVSPADALVPDILIMPGIAFDARGGRVGHGGGFYDRYLQDYGECISHKVAIAYSLQILDQVPTDKFDIPVEAIVTEEGITTVLG